MKTKIGAGLTLVLATLAGCASSPPPAVGAWGASMDTPLGVIPVTLTLREDGTGNILAAGVGEALLDDVEYDGANVTFSATVSSLGQPMSLDFSGTVDGDSLAGAFSSPFGDIPVSGTRQ